MASPGKFVKWTMWCVDHAQTLTTDYVPEVQGEPTHCPLNETHTNISGLAMVDVIDTTPVFNKPYDTGNLEYDKALSCTEDFEVPVHVGDQVSERVIEMPFPIAVRAGECYAAFTAYNQGDKVEVMAIWPGDPAADFVPSDVPAGGRIVPLNGTLFTSGAKPGMFLKFLGQEKEYRIAEMDVEAGTVTLTEDLAAAITAGETVKVRRPFILNKRVYQGVAMRLGDLFFGSSDAVPGLRLRIRYYHAVQQTSEYSLSFTLMYYY